MQIRWHGHSFFSVLTARGHHLVIDPFFRETRKRAADIKADLVLVTHAHSDHAGDAPAWDAPILSTHETAIGLRSRGARTTTGMGIGGTYRWKDLKIFCAFATHSSSFDEDEAHLGAGGNPCGFILDDGETRFYHAGDTGLFGDMRTVIGDLLRPDVAAVPIGDHYTMGIEHAAKAIEWTGAKVALPMHYDTFPAIAADPRAWASLVGERAHAIIPPIDGGIEVRGGAVLRTLPP